MGVFRFISLWRKRWVDVSAKAESRFMHSVREMPMISLQWRTKSIPSPKTIYALEFHALSS